MNKADEERASGKTLEGIAQAEDEKKIADRLRAHYRSGVQHKQSLGLYDEWAEYDRFWNADQWPAPTARTQKFPRPVTNHFASIIEQKVAGLTYELPEMYFEPVEGEPNLEEGGIESADAEASEMLSVIAENQSDKLEYEELMDLGVRSAALLGTGIWFFYWDNTVVAGGPTSQYIGDVKGYEIDATDFFVGDPTNRDMQSQPWVMLAERRPVKEVKTFYERFAPGIVDLLEGGDQGGKDTQVYEHQRTEQKDADYVDVIHCWWKERVENKTVVQKPREVEADDSFSAEVEEEDFVTYTDQLHYAVECQGYLLRHEEDMQPNLYPFICFQWYPKRKSFWGKSESVDLIANQKEDNRLAGIAILAAYNNGVPDLRYHPEYVDVKDLVHGPGGRIIKDSSPGGISGVGYIDARTPAAHIPELRQTVTGGMKETSGVHEAWTGKAPSADLNASAIIALQEAAGVRIRGIQRRLVKAIRETGELWLAYWKEHYTEARLFRKVGPANQIGFVWFNMMDYKEMKFDVRVQAGTASPFSKTLALANLDKMMEMGLISPEEYLDMMPADVMPQAKKILAQREADLEQHFPMIVQMAAEQVIKVVAEAIMGGQQQQQPMDPTMMDPMQPQQPVAGGGGAGPPPPPAVTPGQGMAP